MKYRKRDLFGKVKPIRVDKRYSASLLFVHCRIGLSMDRRLSYLMVVSTYGWTVQAAIADRWMRQTRIARWTGGVA